MRECEAPVMCCHHEMQIPSACTVTHVTTARVSILPHGNFDASNKSANHALRSDRRDRSLFEICFLNRPKIFLY